jgi:prevent-host-death family protein
MFINSLLCWHSADNLYNMMYRRHIYGSHNHTAARQNLAKTIEKVCRDHTPMIVTRKSSESVVIMSLEDFEPWRRRPTSCVHPRTPGA